MTNETQQKLTEVTLALEAEGVRVWGFLFAAGDGVNDAFTTFSGSEMSRKVMIHNTKIALAILEDHQIRSNGTEQVQVYEA